MRTLRVLFGAITLLVAFAVAAPTAFGATATVQPCSQGLGYEASWAGPPIEIRHWDLDADCPSRATLRSFRSAASVFINSNWRYPWSSDMFAPFTSVEFYLRGSDGSDGDMIQGVRVCNGNNCGALITPSSSNVLTPERHFLTAEDFPPGSTQIEVYGACTTAPCDLARPMELLDLKLTMEDDTPPRVQITNNQSGSNPLYDFTGWNTGLRDLSLIAEDDETGVASITAKVGPIEWPVGTSGCGELYYPALDGPCPRYVDAVHTSVFNVSLSSYGLKAGTNPLVVTARDAAGNESEPIVRDFRIDNLRPTITPPNVETDNNHGWQATNKVDISWTSDEGVETATKSGTVRARYDIEPLEAGQINPPLKFVDGIAINRLDDIELPGPGEWRIIVTTVDGAGNISLPREVKVGFDAVIPAAPAITAIGALGAPALAAGTSFNWTAPANKSAVKSGICGYAYEIAPQVDFDPGTTTETEPDATAAELPRTLPNGINRVHLRAVSCSGVGGAIASQAFEVDSAAPQLQLSDPGADGWYTEADPAVLTVNDATQPAPFWQAVIDGVSTPPSDQSPATLDLHDGEQTVTISAEDSLGNETSETKRLAFDGDAPEAVLDPFDPDRPTLLRGRISDVASGVRDASLQLRRAGAEWSVLASSYAPATAPGSGAQIVARIPDLELAAGEYELRLVAADRVGHVTTTVVRADGSAANVTLPLRATANLSSGFPLLMKASKCNGAGRAKHCKTVMKESGESVEEDRFEYGQSRTVSGRLSDARGEPLAGRSLEVFEAVGGASRHRVMEVSTNSAGEFKYVPQAGPSRRISFRFAGSERELPVEASVRMLVRSKLTLKLSKHIVRGGNVRFSGRLSAGGARMPAGGVVVKIQYRSRGAWQLFPLDIRTDSQGRFSAIRRFAHPTHALRYRFRAQVPWFEGWVYETGNSPATGLVVR